MCELTCTILVQVWHGVYRLDGCAGPFLQKERSALSRDSMILISMVQNYCPRCRFYCFFFFSNRSNDIQYALYNILVWTSKSVLLREVMYRFHSSRVLSLAKWWAQVNCCPVIQSGLYYICSNSKVKQLIYIYASSKVKRCFITLYRCSPAYINNNKNKSFTDPKHIHWSDSIQHSDISNTSLHKGDAKNMPVLPVLCAGKK